MFLNSLSLCLALHVNNVCVIPVQCGLDLEQNGAIAESLPMIGQISVQFFISNFKRYRLFKN